MDFLSDPEQESLIGATRDFIDSRIPLRAEPSHLDEIQWKEIAALGWLGLAAAEDLGGSGAALIDEALVFREVGRALVPGPILTTLVAARLAAWTAHPDLARELVSGQTRVARAFPSGDGFLLLDPAGAVLTLSITDDSAALFATPSQPELTPGLEDGSRLGRLDATALAPPVVATDDAELVAELRRVLSILTSAQLAGIVVATCDLATKQARERVQFGRQIGAFQAIKHKCADMAVNTFAAQNIVFLAALTGTNRDALAAAEFCRRAAFANARANIQIRGAMGTTVEDTAHRFLKRTHTLCETEGFAYASARLAALRNED